jgi:hypothetical protein
MVEEIKMEGSKKVYTFTIKATIKSSGYEEDAEVELDIKIEGDGPMDAAVKLESAISKLANGGE